MLSRALEALFPCLEWPSAASVSTAEAGHPQSPPASTQRATESEMVEGQLYGGGGCHALGALGVAVEKLACVCVRDAHASAIKYSEGEGEDGGREGRAVGGGVLRVLIY